MAIMFNPPLRFLTSHMNSKAMCSPFVFIARSEKLLLAFGPFDFFSFAR